MDEKEITNMNILIDKDLKAKFKVKCVENGISMTDRILQMIEYDLEIDSKLDENSKLSEEYND